MGMGGGQVEKKGTGGIQRGRTLSGLGRVAEEVVLPAITGGQAQVGARRSLSPLAQQGGVVGGRGTKGIGSALRSGGSVSSASRRGNPALKRFKRFGR